jgi:hypothetical protein
MTAIADASYVSAVRTRPVKRKVSFMTVYRALRRNKSRYLGGTRHRTGSNQRDQHEEYPRHNAG